MFRKSFISQNPSVECALRHFTQPALPHSAGSNNEESKIAKVMPIFMEGQLSNKYCDLGKIPDT
jgi:hypothetical protein